MRCHRTLAVLFVIAAASGCPRPAAREPLCAPDQLDGGTLVRIERTAEAERALALADALVALGGEDPIAATYEYVVVPDKPLFYFVAGRGRIDRQKLLEDVLRRFGGTVRPGVEPRERTAEGATFLCLPFDRGSGLVAISGVCVFADESISGYAVRTDGGDDDDALEYGAEALGSYRARSASRSACPDRSVLAARAAPPEDRDAVAREIVAAVRGWECKRLGSLLPAGGLAFLEERVTSDFRDAQFSPLEQVCFAMGNLNYPRSETMRIRVEWEREEKARLSLVGGSLDEPAPLELVRDGDAWRLDREWALRVTQDLWTRRAVLGTALTLQGYAAVSGRFTDDAAEVTRRRSVVMDFTSGIAGVESPPDRVHVAVGTDGRSACVSARSRSDAILMIRLEADGDSSRGRFDTAPAECPAKPLDGAWAG